MKKINKGFLKYLMIFFVIIIIITNIPITLSLNNNSSNILEGGWKETIDGVTVLHVSGTNYEMGYQLGYYLKDEYMICHRAIFSFLEENKNFSLEDMIEFWDEMNSSIPHEYKEEMRGRADAIGLSFEEVAAIEPIGVALCTHPKKCCALAAWGPATKDGKLIHISSDDWRLDLKDPVTNKYLSNYQIIIVRKPNNGFSSVCIDLPTEISIDTGVNEQGVVISYTGLTTDNKTNKGIPWGLRQVMVMDHASSAEEAIDIINSNKTIGWSFIIGDSKTPIGYAIEQNANYSYAGTWDNPVENNYPSWTIDHMVRRGNLYLDPISAGIDPGIYKNSTLLRWLLLKFQILNETNYYPAKKHFITLSKTYHCNHGKLNLQNSMKLLRLFYRGWTEPLFFFLQKLPRWYYRNNWHQSVICPETGDILVSFSHNQRSAHKCRIHHFNMYDLFDSKKNNY